MNTIKTNLLLFTLMICIFVQINNGQKNSYTYQGRLTDNNATANGSYDLQFTLFDDNGTQYGAVQTFENVSGVNGVFTVQLEADETAFQGAIHLLEIAVRPGNQTGVFTVLTPRQPITAAPYAITASRAATANVATVALNAVNANDAGSLGGTAANQFVQINNTTAFVRNQTNQQTSVNFTIDGTGTANIFRAATQFNIGGNRVLSIVGTNNFFAGVNAGRINSTGSENSFIGRNAGFSNTLGSSNSFIGTNSGLNNTSGSNNSFVGRDAGRLNVGGATNSFFGLNAGWRNTSGNENVFLGVQAGNSNTTGGNNTMIGTSANVGADNLNFATAIGSGAVVSTSNTIMLDRTSDTVVAPNLLQVGTLGAAGNTSLCRNALNQISTCTAGNLAEKTIENSPEIKTLQVQNAQMLEQIEAQQIVIDGLKKLVCANNPAAAVCQ